MSGTPPTEPTRFQTADWDATLATLNADQSIETGTDDGGSARDDQQQESVDTGQQQRAQTTASTPEGEQQQPTEDQPAPDEEVKLSKRELDELKRQVGQYGANLQQQRQEFEGRVQQALQGRGPEIERIREEAAREGERRAIREQIGQLAPQDRPQWEQAYQQKWAQEDQTFAAQRSQAELEQVKQQASLAMQRSNQVADNAVKEIAKANIGVLLDGYTPRFAQDIGQLLGESVSEAEVKAYLQAQDAGDMMKEQMDIGPEAVDATGKMLVRMAAKHFAAQKTQRSEDAAARREGRNASGIGRDQGGVTARTPVDMNQFKSDKGKAGDWDAMLAALNEQQNIPVAARRR